MRWISLRAGIAGTGAGGEKVSCMSCLWDDMTMGKKKDILSHGFSVKRGLLHKMSMSQTWSPVCGSDLYSQA